MNEITLEAALKVVKAHGIKVGELVAPLTKEEVKRVNDGLAKYGGRVVLIRNGKKLTVFSVAGYKGRQAGAALATKARNEKKATAPAT